jgi:DNA-binding MarR family transcriptional regulator
MPDQDHAGKLAPPGESLLFLREEQIRQAQDMLFFAGRDFAASVDPLLDEAGLGRAHHRALHFIGRAPGMTVSELLAVLAITKQSLARVLTTLQERGFVTLAPGRADRRQRLLHLTETGAALERALFERQRERLLAAYREAGGPAVDGFRRVLRAIMGRQAGAWLDETEAATRTARASIPQGRASRG